jgi:hypothetical protein
LFFKYNRSQVFVCTEIEPEKVDNFLYISSLRCYTLLAKEWLESETIIWLKDSG